MPIHYTIDHAARFVDARVDGFITLDDIEAFADAVVAQDALTYAKLFDASDADGSYNDDDVMALGARAAAYASLAQRGPLAIVPRRNALPELAHRFINLGKFTGQARIFANAEEARAWLAGAAQE